MSRGGRVLLLAGRKEARWLAVSPLTLAGLAVSGWLIWLNNYAPVTVWWAADVSIVACLLAAAGTALLAAQLAAGRPARDGMRQLYASYPAPASVQAGARLAGAAGPVALAALLTAAAVAWLDSRGALGAPRLWVLAAGLLLVALGAVTGSALGGVLRHPVAGFMLVLVLGLAEIDVVLSFDGPVHLGLKGWALPWADAGLLLTSLPGTTVPLPPPAHLAELAGLIVLVAVLALWRLARRRAVIAVVAVAAVAAGAWGGWSSVQPVSGRTMAAMVAQAVQPGAAQQCQALSGVQYCYYPAFAPLARQWAAPVGGVLARVPAAARAGLTVRQVDDTDFIGAGLSAPTGLTSILSQPSALEGKLTGFDQSLEVDPAAVAGTSHPPVYTDLSWTGSENDQLALALSTAEWVTGLPTTSQHLSGRDNTGAFQSEDTTCVPAGQAREAVALWLAAGATPQTRLAAGLTTDAADYQLSVQVGKTWLASEEIGGYESLVTPGLTVTERGAALAAEMLRLPAGKVTAVLAAQWKHWLAPQTTDAGLAAALGLPLPAQPVGRPQPDGYTMDGGKMTDLQYPLPSPVCQ